MMPTTVFTLTETTDRTGYVIGVFAERGMALDAGHSHARHRIDRCRASDERTFGQPVLADTYDIVVREPDAHANITSVHAPSGEIDTVAWQIWPFEIIQPEASTEPEQCDLFPRGVAELEDPTISRTPASGRPHPPFADSQMPSGNRRC